MARPLPPHPVQMTRVYIALDLTNAMLDVIGKFTLPPEIKRKVATVKRWAAQCAKEVPKAPKHAACWRLSGKMYDSISKAIHSRLVTDGELNGMDTLAAWVYCIYGTFLNAWCTCKDIVKGKAWSWLNRTFEGMAEGLFEQYPHGGAIGWAVYCEAETE